MFSDTVKTAVIAIAAVAIAKWAAKTVPGLGALGQRPVMPLAKSLAFWAAVGLAGVAGVGLFKVLVARIPGPDGLNRFAAAL